MFHLNIIYDNIQYFSSINCAGGLLGSISFGYLITQMGSKRATLLSAGPAITFWLLVYYGNHYYCLLLARFISGFGGGGMQTAVYLFISEIANDE